MKSLRSLLPAMLGISAAFAAQACVSSTLVLHVMPDGSGRAVITSQVFESGLKAFDAMFPESPKETPTLESELPAPSEGDVRQQFGAPVRLASTKLDKAADGGVRTTIVEFDDVTKLSTIEFFDAATLQSTKLLYLNKDTTTNLIVMAGK